MLEKISKENDKAKQTEILTSLENSEEKVFFSKSALNSSMLQQTEEAKLNDTVSIIQYKYQKTENNEEESKTMQNIKKNNSLLDTGRSKKPNETKRHLSVRPKNIGNIKLIERIFSII